MRKLCLALLFAVAASIGATAISFDHALAANAPANNPILVRDLVLYDEIQRMQVIRGAVSDKAATALLKVRAMKLLQDGVTDASHRAMVDANQAEANIYFQYVEGIVVQSSNWPAPPQQTKQAADLMMANTRPSYDDALAKEEDPAPVLAVAYGALRLASGDARVGGARTPFDSREQRVNDAIAAARQSVRPAPPARFAALPSPRSTGATTAPPAQPPQQPRGATTPPRVAGYTPPSSAPPAAHTPPPGAYNPPPPANYTPPRAPNQPRFANDQTGLEFGTDRPGNDYRKFEMPARAQANACRQTCVLQNDICRAFTYVKAGVQATGPVCWLKNAAPAAVASDCCVSGTVDPGTASVAARPPGE